MSELPWTWLAIRASGLTAWGLLSAVVIWGILLRTRLLGRVASPMRLLDMHRWLGVTALVFLLIHMVLLIFDKSVSFTIGQILIPGTAPWKAFDVALGTIAFWILIPVTIIGRIRPRLGKRGNAWFKRSHYLAYAAWPLATAHYILAGTDALAAWSLAFLIAISAVIVFALIARGFVPAPAPTRPIREKQAPSVPA
jgi:predicted ferric reductase